MRSDDAHAHTRNLGLRLCISHLHAAAVITHQRHSQGVRQQSAAVPMQAGIFTLSVRIGAQQVFWACISLLELAYAGAVAFGLTSPVGLLPAPPASAYTSNHLSMV